MSAPFEIHGSPGGLFGLYALARPHAFNIDVDFDSFTHSKKASNSNGSQSDKSMIDEIARLAAMYWEHWHATSNSAPASW